MEIEINNTSTTDDDLVQVKCTRPARRHTVPCRIRATGSASASSTVVLTNPDGRLRFPNDTDTTTTLTVPANGSWVAFTISGETGSNAQGDAVIEAHCSTATGAVVATKAVTVFWFDQAQMNVTAGANYTMTGGRFTAVGGNGVNLSARARIRPSGVDCTAPQVANLRIGIAQNALAGLQREKTWGTPTITWNATTATGISVTVPTTMRLTITQPGVANDSETSVAPLYDQPGKSGTLDPNSLKPLMGCTNGAAATSNDTVSTSAPPTLTVPARTSTGTVVGTVTYTLVNVRIPNSFLSWAVVFDTGTNTFCQLRERPWSMNVDSAGPAPQRASPAAADRAPTADAVTAPPFSNAIVNDPVNHTTAAVGAATTTFTKP